MHMVCVTYIQQKYFFQHSFSYFIYLSYSLLFLYIYRNSDTENNFSLFKTDAVDLRRLLCEQVVCLITEKKRSILIILFFIKKFKFHKFVKRVFKMINFITIINIDTPTWPLPTNTNVPKHTQNSYFLKLMQLI
jgi:hypothetical protein